MIITNLLSNETVAMELGMRLKAARIESGLTQADLARKAGVSLGTVSNIERGRDASMRSFVSVLRELGLLQRMDALVPTLQARPSQEKALGHARKRVRHAAKAQEPSAWKWGDEQ